MYLSQFIPIVIEIRIVNVFKLLENTAERFILYLQQVLFPTNLNSGIYITVQT